jgi:hypothetical protein
VQISRNIQAPHCWSREDIVLFIALACVVVVAMVPLAIALASCSGPIVSILRDSTRRSYRVNNRLRQREPLLPVCLGLGAIYRLMMALLACATG